jgi:hypothetical protein
MHDLLFVHTIRTLFSYADFQVTYITSMAAPKSLPKLSDLPLDPSHPPNSAWGLWGKGDKLGSLNYLTDDAVLNAVKREVKTGQRVGLE